MREVRLIGVPRSGTNLVKYLIEGNTDVKCFFNYGWWKHAIIPPLMSQQYTTNSIIPTIIMFREPLRQVVSFYNFARKGRTAMSGASSCGFRNFISSGITMTPDRNAIEYWFPTPVDYWIQFYYAATRWHSRNKIFIELEDLQKNPHIIAAALLEIFPERREVVNPLLPEKYLGRNADRHVSEGWEFETTTTLDKENQEASLLISSLSPGEVANIRTSHTTALYERLKRERSPKTVEAHSAT